MELSERIGNRSQQSVVAFNLGHAYKNIPAMRDFDQAEHWYQRDLELMEDHDTLGRARTMNQFGNIANQRFKDALAAGVPPEQLLRHIDDAADAYTRALRLLPDDATHDLAVVHHGLGSIYGYVGDSARALGHYQQAIQYFEREDNRYGAGQVRNDATVILATAGRHHDALLYAQAALSDFEAVGPGAVSVADRLRRFTAELERERADGEATTASDNI
jgi:tetratricopeptide (TPR) repeat protein